MSNQEFNYCLHILKDVFLMQISVSSPLYASIGNYYMDCDLGIYTIDPQRLQGSANFSYNREDYYIYDLFRRSIFFPHHLTEDYGVPHGFLRIYGYDDREHFARIIFLSMDGGCPFLSMSSKEFLSFMQQHYGLSRKICSILSNNNCTTFPTSI